MKRHKILDGGARVILKPKMADNCSQIFSLTLKYTWFSTNVWFRLFSNQFNGKLFQKRRIKDFILAFSVPTLSTLERSPQLERLDVTIKSGY